MKNFKLHSRLDELPDCAYRVSRSCNAYSFFQCEYKILPEDAEGNLIVPSPQPTPREGTRFLGGIVNRLKSYVFREDTSIVIPLGSREYTYFASEFQRTMSEDDRHNIYIAQEEAPKTKRKA